MNALSFTVEGRPVPKARPRFGRNKSVYTPSKTRDYEYLVALKCKEAMQKVGLSLIARRPLQMTLTFFYAGKKLLHGQPRISAPDLDNLIKTVKDALNEVLYDDDSCVARIFAQKLYAEKEFLMVAVSDMEAA